MTNSLPGFAVEVTMPPSLVLDPCPVGEGISDSCAGTREEVEGNINSARCVEMLESNLWPVVAMD